MLALFTIELIDHRMDLTGEVADALAQQIAPGKLGSFGGQRGAFGGEFVVAAGDLARSPLQFGHLDQPGLEKIDKPAFFGGRVVDLAVQASKLGGEEFIIGDRLGEGDGLLAGQ